MEGESFELPSPVEIDDAYENAGHKGNGRRWDEPTSKHGRKKSLGRDPKRRGYRTKRGRGAHAGREPVVGAISRKNKRVIVESVPDLKAETVHPILRRHIQPGAVVYTDEQQTYASLSKLGYEHKVVNHTAHQWVNEDAHTNSIEGVWSLFRPFSRPHRGLSVEHLPTWTGWFSWMRNHLRGGIDWIMELLGDVLAAPGRLLRALVAERAIPTVCPLPMRYRIHLPKIRLIHRLQRNLELALN